MSGVEEFPVPARLVIGEYFVLHLGTVLETAIMLRNVIFARMLFVVT